MRRMSQEAGFLGWLRPKEYDAAQFWSGSLVRAYKSLACRPMMSVARRGHEETRRRVAAMTQRHCETQRTDSQARPEDM